MTGKTETLPVNAVIQALLSKSSISTTVLLQFVDHAAQLSTSGGKTDIVAEYLKFNPGCEEIITFLTDPDTTLTDVCHVFKVFEQIFIRISEKRSIGIPIGENLGQALLTRCLRWFYRCLGEKKQSFQKTTLRLLTSMVMLSPSSALQVLKNFSFSHTNVANLLNMTNIKDEEDIRTAYVCFLLSFLMSDITVIRQFLQLKGVLNKIFYDMKNDKALTIEIFLSTILSQVVLNPEISKTLKIQVLNDNTLSKVLELFNWTGPINWKSKKRRLHDKGQEANFHEPSSEESTKVYELAYKFLVEVCCSHKTGILFHDRSCGTSGRNFNHHITNILTKVENPTENPYIENLVLRILEASPDQMRFYLLHIQHIFDPRKSSKWITALDFLAKVYDSQKLLQILEKCEKHSISKLVSIILEASFPFVLKKDSINAALLHEADVVRHSMMGFLYQIFKHISMFMEELYTMHEMLNNSHGINVQKFSNCFQIQLLKLIPAVDTFETCWSLVQKQDSEDSEIDDEVLAFDELIKISTLEKKKVALDLQIIIERIFRKNDVKFHFVRFNVINELQLLTQQMDKSDEVEFYLKLIQVTLNTNFDELLQEKEMCSHVIKFLLGLLATSVNDETIANCKLLLLQLVEKISFEEEETELAIWLHHFDHMLYNDKTILASLLQKVVVNFFKKRVLANHGICSLESDDVSMKDSNENSDATFTISDKTGHLSFVAMRLAKYTKFSSLVLSLLEELRNKKSHTDDEYAEIGCSLLCDVLHLQHDPVPLITLLQDNVQSLHNDFCDYVRSLTTDYASDFEMKQKTKETSLSEALKFIFMSRRSAFDFLEQLEKQIICIAKNDSISLWIIARQVLLYMELLINEKQKASMKLMTFLGQVMELIITQDVSIQIASELTVSSLLAFVKSKFYKHIIDDYNETDLYSRKKVYKVFENIFQAAVNRCNSLELKHHIRLFAPLEEKYFATLSTVFLNRKQRELVHTDSVFFELLDVQKIAMLLNMSTIDNIKQHELLVKKLIANFLNKQNSEENVIVSSQFLDDLSLLGLEGRFLLELKNLLVLYPSYGKTLNSGLISCCFNQLPMDDHESLLQVIIMMLKADVKHQEHFKQLLMEKSTDLSLSVLKNLLPVLEAYIEVNYAEFKITATGNFEVLSTLLFKKLWKITKQWFRSDHLLTEKCKFHCYFLELSVIHDSLDVKKFLGFLPSITIDSWILLLSTHSEGLMNVLNTKQEYLNENNLMEQVTTAIMQVFMKLCSDGNSTVAVKNLCRVLTLVEYSQIYDLYFGTTEKIKWSEFIATILKACLKDAEKFFILEFLLHFMKHCLKEEKHLPLQLLHNLLIGHTNFFPIMLGEEADFHKQKELLIEILIEIMVIEPSLCLASHLPFYLSCYHATLQRSDQLLLQLIHVYEKHNISLSKFRPYMWGSAAVPYYSVQKNLSFSLDNEPKVDDVLCLFESEKMLFSAFNFPLNIQLKTGKIVHVDEESSKKIYDPRFILPLLSYMLSPENYVNLKRLLESNILTVAFAALSSNDSPIRAAAYYIFTQLYPHLEFSRYLKHRILLQILNALSHSLPEPNMKLSNIMSHFLAKTSRLIVDAHDSMSLPIFSFIFLKPHLELTRVPDFLKLFHSSDFHQFREHRRWILDLLIDGIRDQHDVEVCEKNHCIKMILLYCQSRLCNNHEMLQILSIMEKISIIKNCHLKFGKIVLPILKAVRTRKWDDQHISTRIAHLTSVFSKQ